MTLLERKYGLMTKVHLPYHITRRTTERCKVPIVDLSYSYSSVEAGTWWFANHHLHNYISNILWHQSHEIQDSWKVTTAAIVSDILPHLTYKKANITIKVTGKVQEFIRIPKSIILLQIWRCVIQFPLKSVVNFAVASITFAQEIILTSILH